MRQVADDFKVSLRTVQRWVHRAGHRRLDRVEWSDRPCGVRVPATRTPRRTEDLVLALRTELRETSDLGEFGARAIHDALLARGVARPPSVRTVNRILARHGAFEGRGRVRRPAPPRGWYLPDLAARDAELDSFDFIEGLVIQGGPELVVLTAISLHGGLPAAWPEAHSTSKSAAKALIAHWQAFGCPAYAQFDNDTRFQGPHHHPDTLGRIARLCLSLGVVPVFVPPRETGFQACIESFNGRWQAKVWARFHHESLADLRDRSARYLIASRARGAVRIEAAPGRTAVPPGWSLDLQAKPQGKLVYLRRTDAAGRADLLGHGFQVDGTWTHRLVRAEVDLDHETISFFALRRRAPHDQALLRRVHHVVPHRPFRE